MITLDLFSGIAGFGLAFEQAGASTEAFCEKDASCHKVLRRHYPGRDIYPNVETITQEYTGRPDVITGGFPCQDLSVAGRRKGLVGERSGLWFAMLHAVKFYQPRWVVIENVPGLLSSNGGRDFAVILRGLVECGYGVSWRVFDAQYAGVAQRRQRVFIVGSLGSGRSAEVLFEREGGAWDSAPSREARERFAGDTGTSFKRRGGFGWSAADDIAGTLEAEGGTHRGGPERVPLVVREIAPSVTANYGKQADNSDTALGPNLVMAFQQGASASQSMNPSAVSPTLDVSKVGVPPAKT